MCERVLYNKRVVCEHYSVRKTVHNIYIYTLIKRAALAEEHPRSASNRARIFSASSSHTSRSTAQLVNVLSVLRYKRAT